MIKLLEAKKQFPPIKKDAWNPFYKSNYASLSNILDAIEPVLEKHGLYIRSVLRDNVLITQICELETGNVNLESCFNLPVLNDIQKIGSAITYARRYNLVAMLNLNIENDDDGNSTKETPKTEPKKEVKKPEPISKECQNYINYINNADTLQKLKDVGTALASEPTLTKNDKDHLREIYKQKEKELK